MKKSFYQMLLFIVMSIVSAISANAQVRIGGAVSPHQGAVLDLNADNTSVGFMGLLLPRVSLNNTSGWQLAGNPVEGMVIYNNNPATGKGIYVWMGATDGWVAVGAAGNTTPPQQNAVPINTIALYTPAAKAQANQNGTIDALIDKVVQQANAVMSAAQIDTVFKLVHKQEIPYTESPASPNVDLSQLRKNNTVQGLLTQYKAQSAILLIDDAAPDITASGYLSNDASGNAEHSFSVIKISTIP